MSENQKRGDRRPQVQVEVFREAARNLACDESEENFARKLGAIAKAKKGGGPPKSRRRSNSR
jgi:hypothetical protein